MKRLLLGLVAAALAAGCSSASDEGDAFPRVVGSYCPSGTHSSATQLPSGDWSVDAYYNDQHDQVVADHDGVLRTQTVRECKHVTVIYQDTPGWTAADALSQAAFDLGHDLVL
jgi:hypothetical protein